MLELSKEFKRLKLTNTPHRYLQGKNIVLLFEKTLYPHAARSRWPAWTWAWALPSWIRFQPDGQKESIEDTARCWAACMTASSTAASTRELVEQLSRDSGVPVVERPDGRFSTHADAG